MVKKSRFRKLLLAGWVPDQHGAWPMALLPALVGISLAGWTLVHAWLFTTWLVGFLFFNVAGIWFKAKPASRVRTRVKPAFLTYLGLTLGFAAVLAGWLGRAQVRVLLPWALFFIPLMAVTFGAFYRGDERSLVARVATIGASVLMLPFSFGLLRVDGGFTASGPWLLTGIFGWFFIASTLFVRSVIRGKDDNRVLAASWLWHGLGFGGFFFPAVGISIVWLGFVGLAFTRAVWLPLSQRRGLKLTAGMIGGEEFLMTLLLLFFMWFA
ncbi:MAG: YwiC-like family protein [Actinomycetaceae bacterium]|nr:YwiC-like family protein [Actinomycetaceae bacterium]